MTDVYRSAAVVGVHGNNVASGGLECTITLVPHDELPVIGAFQKPEP